MSLIISVVNAIERVTDKSIEELRATPLDVRRQQIETAQGKPTRFTPRGLVSHEEANRMLAWAVR